MADIRLQMYFWNPEKLARRFTDILYGSEAKIIERDTGYQLGDNNNYILMTSETPPDYKLEGYQFYILSARGEFPHGFIEFIQHNLLTDDEVCEIRGRMDSTGL